MFHTTDPKIVCPRCHKKNLTRIEFFHRHFPEHIKTINLVCEYPCEFIFKYCNLSYYWIIEYSSKLVMPPMHNLDEMADIFNYEGIATHASELWANVRTAGIQWCAWIVATDWFHMMLLVHHKHWHSILHKIFNRGEDEGWLILPDIIWTFIIPMLGFETADEAINKKIAARSELIEN